MSVNSSNKNQNNTTAPAAPVEGAMPAAFAAAMNQSNQTNAIPQTRRPISLGSLGSMINVPLSRTSEGEALSNAIAAFTKAASVVDTNEFKIDIIPVDMNNVLSVRISALVVALTMAGIEGVAFHTVILDGSIEKPKPLTQTANNQTIQVWRLAGDYNDDKMLSEILAILGNKYRGKELFNADASVLDRDFPLADEKATKLFMANVLAACTTELSESTGNVDSLNLAYTDNNTNVHLRRLWNMNEATLSLNNHPVRSNVQLTMSVSPKDVSQQSRSSEIAKVDGFLDIVYINQQQAGINSYFNPNQQMPKFYRPRFVMTNLECKGVNTVTAQLLALLQVATLTDNCAWARAFTNENHIAHRDFGAVGLEAPTRNPDGTMSTKRIDTREAAFKPEHLYRFISETVENNLLFTMHVPDCAPESWINRVFAESARGNQKATQFIIAAANELTNGNFSRHFNQNIVCVHEDNRVINGYYYDEKGRKCDIRDVDYLHVLNAAGEQDMNVIRRWSDSYYPIASIEKRMSDRMGIIEAILGQTVTFTGFSTPVTFLPSFVSALVSAAADCGFSWQVQDSGQDITTMQRGYAQLDQRFDVNGQFSSNLNRGTGGGFGNVGLNNTGVFRF